MRIAGRPRMAAGELTLAGYPRQRRVDERAASLRHRATGSERVPSEEDKVGDLVEAISAAP
jgi:hypothetical protein